jgi:hypothetical protein
MNAPNDPTPLARPTAGMTVTSRFNPDWGAGTVLNVQGERAQVLFTQHPARKPVVVPWKSLVITRAGQWDTAVHAMHNKASAPSTRSTGTGAPKKKRKYSTTTQEEAVRLFLERFPGGFAGEAFLKEERNQRWEAHLAYERELGGDKLRELLAAGKVEDVVHRALHAQQGTNLLSVFEKARLSKALRADSQYAERVFSALADVLAHEAPEEESFARYLDLVQAVPAGTPGQRQITWPIATILPHLAAPERHLFLKPVATQAAAERLGLDLQYQAALNWNTYQRALGLAAGLREALAVHGCRDLVDVQSFIWVVH